MAVSMAKKLALGIIGLLFALFTLTACSQGPPVGWDQPGWDCDVAAGSDWGAIPASVEKQPGKEHIASVLGIKTTEFGADSYGAADCDDPLMVDQKVTLHDQRRCLVVSIRDESDAHKVNLACPATKKKE